MRSFYWVLCLVLIIGNVLLYKDFFAPPALEARVFEVGKGKATLIRTSSGKTLLIDTGPDAGILRALGMALPMWQRSLNAVILTSSEHDSVGGLRQIQERYRIKNLISTLTRGDQLILDNTAYIRTISLPKKKISPLILQLSYGSDILTLSSSTPPGVYVLDGVATK